MPVNCKKETIIYKTMNKKSFFWCPLLDEIGFLSSGEFRDGLLKAMTGYNLRKEVSLALDRVVSDFESSKCSTFEEYYKIKEHDFLITCIIFLEQKL